jgi:hypothetical protein
MAKMSKLDMVLRAAAVCKAQPNVGAKVLLFTDFGMLECEIDEIPKKPLSEMPNELLIKSALAIKEDKETKEKIEANEDSKKNMILLKNISLLCNSGGKIKVPSMTIFLDSVEAVSVGHLHLDI